MEASSRCVFFLNHTYRMKNFKLRLQRLKPGHTYSDGQKGADVSHHHGKAT